MSMNEFKISFRENGKVHVMDLRGYLDAHTAPNLEEAFQGLIKEKKLNILVNCTDLAYISSAGLGVFMAFIEDVRTGGGDIKMSNMSPKVYNIFDLLGFPMLYEIFTDEHEAVKKFDAKKQSTK
jgi:anti-sigma B factor antagonist